MICRLEWRASAGDHEGRPYRAGRKEKDADMTTKADYTPQEWELLQKPLLMVGPAVAEAVDSGALGTLRLTPR